MQGFYLRDLWYYDDMSYKLKAFYLFGKSPLPKDIDRGTQSILNELADVTDKTEYLQRAYDLITRHYRGERQKTFSRIWELFSQGIEDLTNRSGFMHCTNQNYILSNVLVKSGLFSESDIRLHWTSIWYITPHQYLEVTIGSRKYFVDCWARHYGIPFGSYARGFNTSIRRSFAE